MKETKDMIKFFERVKAQHKAIIIATPDNKKNKSQLNIAIGIYDFVIGKLEEWDVEQ